IQNSARRLVNGLLAPALAVAGLGVVLLGNPAVAEPGSLTAGEFLVEMARGKEAYEHGDYAEALRWYGVPADRGVARAQSIMGLAFENGRGVTSDFPEAASWYRKASDQGLAEAQAGLARLYELGRGVPQDYVEAMRWFRRAAKQGWAPAQN